MKRILGLEPSRTNPNQASPYVRRDTQDVIGDVEQAPVGYSVIRAGEWKSDRPADAGDAYWSRGHWCQTLHLVLTPAEREELIAALIAHRENAPARIEPPPTDSGEQPA
jgi:hypothetical protein